MSTREPNSHYFRKTMARLAPLQDRLPRLYLVGGRVRDYLLGRPGGDLDLTCTTAEETARKLAAFWDVPLVGFRKTNRQSCFRVVFDADRDDFMDFTPLQGETLEEDLARRDFTINALAMEIGPDGPGRILDPFGGRQDLAAKLVRMTSKQVLADDPLRILRGFRFCAQLDFRLEADTRRTMQDQAGLLQTSAPERISHELFKLFEAPETYPILRQMDRSKVLEVVFPEIASLRHCEQNGFHHLDVWRHSLLALERSEDILKRLDALFGPSAGQIREILNRGRNTALFKIAVLFHDLGKPKTRGLHPQTGRITFYGHDRTGAELIEALARRLRMSTRHQALLRNLVAEHIHVYALSRKEVKESTRMRFFRTHRDRSVLCILLAMADIEARLSPASDPEEQDRYRAWALQAIDHYLKTSKIYLEKRPLLSGQDILNLGLGPGPCVGRVLRRIQEAEDDGHVHTREQALALAEDIVARIRARH
ncbi:MAG: HD domain-containing protein [Desulfohalobiaceae bacterium]|nr:HD domain-containing protein [Desulfohalobiaceae bacterium]